MAYELSNYAVKATFVAFDDLSAHQYELVQVPVQGSGGPVEGFVTLATDSSRVLGVLQNAPKAGQEAEVVLIGITKVKTHPGYTTGTYAGERVSLAQDPINERAAVTNNSGAGWIIGRALTNSAPGEIATVALATPAANYFVD